MGLIQYHSWIASFNAIVGRILDAAESKKCGGEKFNLAL